MATEPELLREILHRALARYLTVRPQGLVIDQQRKPLPAADVRILGYGGARTRYENRRPMCRSLDTVKSVTHPTRLCTGCDQREWCTPQLRVDLILESQPFRLLLSFTSARNFLEYTVKLRRRNLSLEDTRHRIEVVDRATWGEIRFHTIS
jgi:hypothetical protein